MQPVPDYALSVSEKLKALTNSGELQADSVQLGIARKLDHILIELREKRAAAKTSALGWLFAAKRRTNTPVRGVYIHGSVGRGKTMLMDMFFALAPIQKKRRAHFHEFMADVHGRIHAHRQRLKNGETRETDPVPPVAAEIFAEAELLCFDEFTVTDIADAMILSRLFSALFARGCILVATSNVAPDNLYRDGLNRGLFLPFIDILKAHVDVVALDSPTDYRMEKLDSMPVYHTPPGPETERAMDAAWAAVTAGHAVGPIDIQMKGRVLHVPRSSGRAARFTFAELCEQPLGASDYLALSAEYDIIFLDDVPILGTERRNATKRLIILVDALYDHSVRLVMSAADWPEKLLSDRRGVEGFEFDRTVSRLFEMRSADYLARHRSSR
ncbi:cell division protein ZapE [Gellertiella hungarica]|uniref:Cell division protein ZapE n=1 Tax=Gellertiella hungarica TaxID=1572859 RepID=A0A7W6NKA4_9HYPH|nr:cell division protein ZapE [Gellertiella hungarica]MBB4065225.1 cell division protein ZapE [Gellertiella hungarica]